MSSCNTSASERGLKAGARQSWMSACLGGKSDQTTVMRVCNAQAGQDKLAAGPRREFLKTCLKSAG
jgi:hypothetical protein